MKIDLFGLFESEIAEAIKKVGLEPFRAKQISNWIYQKNVTDFDLMLNLSKKTREVLAEHFIINTAASLFKETSKDQKTSKYLLSFDEATAVESVLMRQPYGNSVCLSTQAGCAMSCAFCASTLKGLARNLESKEILAQVLFIENELKENSQGKVDTIVLMGSGEPLANYDNVLRFIRLCHEPYILNMSYRRITLSTCGIVPNIKKLATEDIPINLSISLHAPNNELRSELMPVNKKYSIEELIEAADFYAEKTGRRVTYEYTLIANKNDSKEHAKELANLLKGKLANINLIPVNEVKERGFLKPSGNRIKTFEEILKTNKANYTVRKEMGADISAACGQLKNKILK